MDTVILKFTPETQFDDDELFAFCAANSDLRIERNNKGELIIMSPVGGLGSSQNNTVSSVLWSWNQQRKMGITFDSSGGFNLPDGSMLSPDAAFISNNRWRQLKEEEKRKFPPITPDFLIEVRSASDSLKQLQSKMNDWIRNGCRLAWLIDPIEQKAYVYTGEGLIQTIPSFEEKLSGRDVLPDYEFDLALLK